MANVGGPPTDDKPAVTLIPRLQVELASYALNVRVADVQTADELWRSRGAHFLTPPIARAGEIRCYLRDPDGHLIELGQSVPDTHVHRGVFQSFSFSRRFHWTLRADPTSSAP